MSRVEIDILALKREFVREMLDLAFVHASWASRYLGEDQDALADAAFQRFIDVVRPAVIEMKAITTVRKANSLTAEVAAEYRERRDAARKPEAPVKRSA